MSALADAIQAGVITVGIGTALSAFNDQIKVALQNGSKQIVRSAGLGTGSTGTTGTTTLKRHPALMSP